MEMALPADITLQQLFDNYVNEVSRRTKGKSKRAHDERSARMFARFFGGDRRASSLNVRDWNDFIVARREGTIGPSPERSRPVRDRQIEYDLKFLLAVLNWATKARVDGERLLECNPLKGLYLPKEKNPRRPITIRGHTRTCARDRTPDRSHTATPLEGCRPGSGAGHVAC
jgi:hypothetical protein